MHGLAVLLRNICLGDFGAVATLKTSAPRDFRSISFEPFFQNPAFQAQAFHKWQSKSDPIIRTGH